jgi:hypothetical protein
LVNVPFLDALIGAELSAAEQWLSNAPKPAPHNAWDTANRLHLDLSQRAYREPAQNP